LNYVVFLEIMITIENEIFTLSFNTKGAELKSVFDKRFQKNILYDGLSSYWNRSAPILFPIVGKLRNNLYQYNLKEYTMFQHGFARDIDYKIVEKNEHNIVFQTNSTQKTKKIYPFNFNLKIGYSVNNSKITTTYQIENSGKKILPFSLGAHPGFVCPIHEDEKFEDYYLEFDAPTTSILNRFMLDDGLLNGKMEKIILEGNTLPLNYKLFENDALVLKYLESVKIHLKSHKSSYHLTFRFKDFPFFGIWTKQNASYICLEPWCGIPDSVYSNNLFYEKEGINFLEAGELFERSYSFEINF
jgi:galactose mutarotase-like enzyme